MSSSDVPQRLTPDDLTNNLVAGLRSAKSLYRTSAQCTFLTNELPAVRGVVDLAGGNPSRSRGGRRGTGRLHRHFPPRVGHSGQLG